MAPAASNKHRCLSMEEPWCQIEERVASAHHKVDSIVISNKDRGTTTTIIIMTIILPYLSETPGWHSTVNRSRARHGFRCCMVLWCLSEMQRERCGVLSIWSCSQIPIMFERAVASVDSSDCNSEPMWQIKKNKHINKCAEKTNSSRRKGGAWGLGGGGWAWSKTDRGRRDRMGTCNVGSI